MPNQYAQQPPYPGAPIIGYDAWGQPLYIPYNPNNNSTPSPTPAPAPTPTYQQTVTPSSGPNDPRDPYKTGRVYNTNVDQNTPHYVYNATGGLTWYDPSNPPADISNGNSGGGSQPNGTQGGGAGGGAQAPNDFQNYSDLPDSIKNSPSWASLTADQKSLAYFTYKTQTANNEAQKKDAQAALEKAKSLVDPFFKEQIRIAQDEISRNVTSVNQNAESKVNSLNDRIRQIKEDLTYNKDQLSLEQQAELSGQLRQNTEDLNNLQQQMADNGLAYSSPRARAEEVLTANQTDMAESTRRKYNRMLHEYDTNSTRGIDEATQNINDINRQKNDSLTEIIRGGEAKLGSNNVPNTYGVPIMGGITGSLEEQKQNQVANLQGTLQTRQDPFNF